MLGNLWKTGWSVCGFSKCTDTILNRVECMWVFQAHRHHLKQGGVYVGFPSAQTPSELNGTKDLLLLWHWGKTPQDSNDSNRFPWQLWGKMHGHKEPPLFQWCWSTSTTSVLVLLQSLFCRVGHMPTKTHREEATLHFFFFFFLERKPLEKSVFQNRTHQEKGSNDRKGKTLGERILQHRTHRERGLSCNWKRRRPKRCSH